MSAFPELEGHYDAVYKVLRRFKENPQSPANVREAVKSVSPPAKSVKTAGNGPLAERLRNVREQIRVVEERGREGIVDVHGLDKLVRLERQLIVWLKNDREVAEKDVADTRENPTWATMVMEFDRRSKLGLNKDTVPSEVEIRDE